MNMILNQYGCLTRRHILPDIQIGRENLQYQLIYLSSYAGHSLNMLQLIIYDIAFAAPECLFISGFDFYTSKEIYKKGYVDNTLDKIKEEVKNSMIEGGHDPITNIRYFVSNKSLLLKVQLSGKLARVIALEEWEYLSMLKTNILES